MSKGTGPEIISLKPFKDLPGFDKAFAELLEREAREGSWCDYGFPLGELGNVVAPGVLQIPDFATLQQFAQAISNARKPPLRSPRRLLRLRLVPPPRIAANDCEAPT